MILVVSRDILIVGGIMLAWLVGKPFKIKPLVVSKLNTVAQIVFACVVLGSLGFHIEAQALTLVLMGLVAVLTLLSVAAYVARVGAPHELGGGQAVSTRPRTAPRRDAAKGERQPNSAGR